MTYGVEYWVERPDGSITYHVLYAPIVRVTPLDAARRPAGEPTTFGREPPPERGTP